MLIHTLSILSQVYTVIVTTLESLKITIMTSVSSFEKICQILFCGNAIQMPEGNWAKTNVADANKLSPGRMEGHLLGQDKTG